MHIVQFFFTCGLLTAFRKGIDRFLFVKIYRNIKKNRIDTKKGRKPMDSILKLAYCVDFQFKHIPLCWNHRR